MHIGYQIYQNQISQVFLGLHKDYFRETLTQIYEK